MDWQVILCGGLLRVRNCGSGCWGEMSCFELGVGTELCRRSYAWAGFGPGSKVMWSFVYEG